MTDDGLYAKGIEARRGFLGAEYVDASLSEADDFMMAFQRAVTELAWGYSWTRPGLDLRTIAVELEPARVVGLRVCGPGRTLSVHAGLGSRGQRVGNSSQVSRRRGATGVGVRTRTGPRVAEGNGSRDHPRGSSARQTCR